MRKHLGPVAMRVAAETIDRTQQLAVACCTLSSLARGQKQTKVIGNNSSRGTQSFVDCQCNSKFAWYFEEL